MRAWGSLGLSPSPGFPSASSWTGSGAAVAGSSCLPSVSPLVACSVPGAGCSCRPLSGGELASSVSAELRPSVTCPGTSADSGKLTCSQEPSACASGGDSGLCLTSTDRLLRVRRQASLSPSAVVGCGKVQPFGLRPLVLVSASSGTKAFYGPHVGCGQPA